MAINVVGVFCEDIREEKSGQVTLVGILPDNINMPPPPPPGPEVRKQQAIIPKLALYIRINMGVEDDPGPMTVKLLLSDGSELDIGTLDAELIARAKRQAAERELPIAGVVNQAVMSGFQPPGPGLILAFLQAKDQRYPCAVLNLIEQPRT